MRQAEGASSILEFGEAHSDCVLDQSRLIVDIQLLHNMILMGFHGLFADTEVRSNLGDRIPLGDQLQNLPFPAGKEIIQGSLLSQFCPSDIFVDHFL
jgi:hypothetical protein